MMDKNDNNENVDVFDIEEIDLVEKGRYLTHRC